MHVCCQLFYRIEQPLAAKGRAVTLIALGPFTDARRERLPYPTCRRIALCGNPKIGWRRLDRAPGRQDNGERAVLVAVRRAEVQRWTEVQQFPLMTYEP
jgi:hypothetical protein